MAEELAGRIIDFLKTSHHDLTISDIASSLSVERHTAAKHLETLRARGLCEYRVVGRSKLWRIVDSPLLTLISDGMSPLSKELSSLLAGIGERITIQDDNNRIVWSNDFELVNKKCFEAFTRRKTSCPDCPVKQTFDTGKAIRANGHDGVVTTTPLKKRGSTVAVVNITTR